ncbi:MAG: c-type cytochrome [Parafilimonas sp.]
MIYSNKRKINLVLFFAACVFISVAATKPSEIKDAALSQTSTSDTSIFKNLQVLPKDISKDSLDHVMHGFTAALGVKCNFCHVHNDATNKMDFASDDKDEKGIARHMIHMAADINAKYFNWENSTRPDTISVVRCVTCHHGNPHPDEAAMMVGDNHGNMQPPPPPHDSTGKMPPPPNQ